MGLGEKLTNELEEGGIMDQWENEGGSPTAELVFITSAEIMSGNPPGVLHTLA